MKCGIISMQRVINQGSFLQAYGLMKLLEQRFEAVQFIDIKPGISNESFCERFVESYDVPLLSKPLIRILERKQRHMLLNEQEKWLGLESKPSDEAILDAVFIGSDEVFNCLAPSSWGVSEQLFGKVDRCRHVFTYAASCGHTSFDKIPKSVVNYISGAMRNLEGISVRDRNTQEFVKCLIDKEPKIYLDPVLMYGFDKETVIPKINKPYLLVYSYTNRICNKEVIAHIKKFAKEEKLLIVGVGVFQYWCDKNIPVTPFETLGYFKNATYVITDTFHGTIMSVKYNKQFVTIVKKSNYNKLFDLLLRLGLTNRCIEDMSNLSNSLKNKIDYENTNAIISNEKEHTLSYLERCAEVAKED